MKIVRPTTVKSEAGTMMLLPPAPDKCQECATDHKSDQPCNAQSLFYQMNFKMKNGRYPTWIDAMSHCTDDVKKQWKGLLLSYGVNVDDGQVNPKKAVK